jgi:hypothetical protein
MAFHEKAGRSQVDSSCFFVGHVIFPKPTVASFATLPSALFEERSLVSLGASWVFSLQLVLPPDFRPLFLSSGTWPGH